MSRSCFSTRECSPEQSFRSLKIVWDHISSYSVVCSWNFFCYKIFLTASIPTCLPTIQCDQIGLLLKSLGDIFACKISPNIGQLYVQSKKLSFNVKTTLVTFWGNFAENWATFNSSVWSHCYHLFGVRF